MHKKKKTLKAKAAWSTAVSDVEDKSWFFTVQVHCKYHVAHKSSQVWPFDIGSAISQCPLLFPRETWDSIENLILLDQVITFAIKCCSPLFRQRINFLLYLSISFTSPCLLLQSLHLSLTFFSRWERLAIDLCSIHPFPVSRRAESLSLYPQSPSINHNRCNYSSARLHLKDLWHCTLPSRLAANTVEFVKD